MRQHHDDRLVAAWGNLGRILAARDRLPEAIDQVWFDRKPRPAHAFAHTRKPAATPAQLLDLLNADAARLGLRTA